LLHFFNLNFYLVFAQYFCQQVSFLLEDVIHYFDESEKLWIFLCIELLAFLWVISVDKLFFQVCIGNQVKAAKT
jgi:hypothetical protein